MENIYNKTEILIITDITFNPILKIINETSSHFEVSLKYYEDIIIGLNEIILKNLTSYSFLLIHSDQIFHYKPLDWQISLMKMVNYFCLRHPNLKVIFSNAINTGYSIKTVSESIGYLFDIPSSYSQQISNIISQDNLFIFDFTSIIKKIGGENSYNYELGALYQMPYTKDLINSFAADLIEFIKFLSTEEKKVIVLDCDNTLWNGIIGEDGIENISCDKNAEGLLFYRFQSFLKSRKEDGFLMCICSKNNEEEVKRVFETKKMPLIWDDFIIKKINWSNKSENIKEIAKELNLGEESFIFIDDNPFEINSVKNLTNVKCCIQFENNFGKLLQLTDSYVFRKKRILTDDKSKNEQYKQNALREKEKEKFNSIDDFIASLDLKIELKVNAKEEFQRLSQLTEKTNQFNFNKKPFSISELNNWVNNNNLIFSIKVTDKYGDYGTVGLILIRIKEQIAVLENYILSCRVLGKKVEIKFLEQVIAFLKNENFIFNEILFKETTKNVPAKQFLNNYNYASITRTIN